MKTLIFEGIQQAFFLSTLLVSIYCTAQDPFNKGPPSLVGQQTSQRKTVQEGKDVKLICPVKGNPEPIVEWTKGDEEGRVESWGRIRVAKNWLRIRETRPEDRGVYVCHAINGFGSVQFSFIVIVVGGLSNILNAASENLRMEQVSPPAGSDIKEVIGRSVKFQCQAEGTPEPEITWFKDGAMLDPNQRIRERLREFKLEPGSLHTLSLDQISFSDSGNYSCLASNLFGVSWANWTLTVLGRGTYKNSLNGLEMSNVTAYEGDDAVLSCQGSWNSDAAPKVMWLREIDDKEWKNLASNRTFMFKGQQYEVLQPSEVVLLKQKTFTTKLIVANVGIKDNGRYVCTASGRFGVNVQQAYLAVIKSEFKRRPIFLVSGVAMGAVVLIVVGVSISLCREKKSKRPSSLPAANERAFINQTPTTAGYKIRSSPPNAVILPNSYKSAVDPSYSASLCHLTSSQLSQKSSDASRHEFSNAGASCLDNKCGQLYFSPSVSTTSFPQHHKHQYHQMNVI